jgi:hypothetical protein
MRSARAGSFPRLSAPFAWELIVALTDDPTPTSPGTDRDHDLLSLAVNSTKGPALEAVFAFAAWGNEADSGRR